MSSGSLLSAEFKRLRSSPDAHQRGRKLEELLERLFQQAHFRVKRNAGIARPRQTDLVASYGDLWYLIEAKWLNTPADVDVFDAVRSRLERAASASVVGVIVSVSGFTKSVVEEVVNFRGRQPVLLFGEEELTQALRSPESLFNVLRVKRNELVTHGRVHLAAGAKPRRGRRPSSDLPASDLTLLDAELKPLPYITAEGDFADLVFTQELPDVDWVPAGGSGVCLDLPIGAFDENGLADLLYALSSMGWTTPRPRWNIQQSIVNWHGMGAREFLDTLRAWRERYKGIDLHHTEQVTYFDVCQEGGFYTLSADISAHPSRVIYRCNVSFQLVGIPVDVQPIRHLFEQFDAPGYFRPLTTKSVTRTRTHSDVLLEPVTYIVSGDPLAFDPPEPDPSDDEPARPSRAPEQWVTGIVAKNPFRKRDGIPAPEDWPRQAEASELIICDLRSHHQLDKLRVSYHLDGWEQARTSDARAFRPVADW